jgi:hypothetical protein
MAEKFTTNRYCLIEDFSFTQELAFEFEAGGGEPGPYFIAEVFRKRAEGHLITFAA